MNWLWKLPDGAQHSIIAAGIMALAGVPLWAIGCPYPAVVGALFGIVWFHGREVADADSVNRRLLDNFLVVFPWVWHDDSQADFHWPLITNCLLAVAVEAVARAL